MQFVEIEGVPGGDLADQIVALCGVVLPAKRSLDMPSRMTHTSDAWSIVALLDGRVVGFKLGFCDRPERFYSWMGGVHPDFRRRGIARELMRLQAQRSIRVGYTRIRRTGPCCC